MGAPIRIDTVRTIPLTDGRESGGSGDGWIAWQPTLLRVVDSALEYPVGGCGVVAALRQVNSLIRTLHHNDYRLPESHEKAVADPVMDRVRAAVADGMTIIELANAAGCSCSAAHEYARLLGWEAAPQVIDGVIQQNKPGLLRKTDKPIQTRRRSGAQAKHTRSNGHAE